MKHDSWHFFEEKTFLPHLTSVYKAETILDRFLVKFYVKFTYWPIFQCHFERKYRLYPLHRYCWKANKIQHHHSPPIYFWLGVKNPLRLTTNDPNYVYRHQWLLFLLSYTSQSHFTIWGILTITCHVRKQGKENIRGSIERKEKQGKEKNRQEWKGRKAPCVNKAKVRRRNRAWKAP